jgi:hypothetical protein
VAGEKLERETGFEPATSTLARSHSTTELLPLNELIINEGLGGGNGYGWGFGVLSLMDLTSKVELRSTGQPRAAVPT